MGATFFILSFFFSFGSVGGSTRYFECMHLLTHMRVGLILVGLTFTLWDPPSCECEDACIQNTLYFLDWFKVLLLILFIYLLVSHQRSPPLFIEQCLLAHGASSE